MAGRSRTQHYIPTSDFNDPQTISEIYKIAYEWGDRVPSGFSILPPYFEVFRHHLSTTNIPSDDDNNTDLSLIRACFFAFGKGISALHGESGTEALYEDILALTETILSWTRYFFHSFDMSTGLGDNPDFNGIPDSNLSCIAHLLSSLATLTQFRHSLYSEPSLVQNIVRFWLELTLHGYQSAYEFRAFMATITAFDDTKSVIPEALRLWNHQAEDVVTVIIRGLIEDQFRHPQKYVDYIRGGTLLTFCARMSPRFYDCIIAQKSVMWCCRAIRILVSKPKRYFPPEARARAVALENLIGYVFGPCRYVYNLAEALDFRLLESVLTFSHFISLNEESLGTRIVPPKFYNILDDILELVNTFTIYRSVLRRILRTVKHADKFESTLGEGRAAQRWYHLKVLALERSEDMHQYDLKESKGLFICENRECPNKDINLRSPSRRCGGCSNVMYCSPECQKVDWKADGGHRLTYGKSHGISCIDYEFFVAKCGTDIREHLNLIRALRTQDLNEQVGNPEPVATTIVMSYIGSGNGVRMLRRDMSICATQVGEDKWRLLKKDGEQVIVIMELPYDKDEPVYFAIPFSQFDVALTV
ncbi:uncharacterized protein ARMOST_20184 [Armillaria ostoyae]|uniref:MYND-type domain-containing protein n=1 Tax=Armillaria ostoyae TaxID=47428 RepID=A0A284S6L6_ARMOS|nr:uncharacterized protein ARMOST_20184 [Armillaria ostoyae]